MACRVKIIIVPTTTFTSVINYGYRMNQQPLIILIVGIIIAAFISLSDFNSKSENNNPKSTSNISLKEQAFRILETKCNSCHKKQNPLMIFSKRNMEKRVSKITKEVFVTQKMRKGDAIKLTKNEYAILQEWISTQSIN